jgi:hypothetical protein
MRRVAGEITKIDNGTVTIISRNRSNERTIDLKLDENVKVTVESNEKVRVMGEGGDVQERRKAVSGKPSDLKVGQRVIATTTFGGVATEISASSAPAQGEGERARGDAPRDGERPRADAPRDGERPRVEGAGDAPRAREGGDRGGAAAPMAIAVEVNGDLTLDGRRIELAQLTETLSEAVKRDRTTAVTIRAAKEIRFEDLKTVLAGVSKAGVSKVSFLSTGRRTGDGDGPPPARGDAPRDGERPRGDAPRDGEARARAAREGERNAGGETISGDIARVSADAISVKTASSANAAATLGSIRVSPDTQVVIEGTAAKLSDLQPGMPVNVTMRNGQAAKIEVPIDLSKPKK